METSIYFLVNAAAGGHGGADVASALPHLLAKFGLTCAVRLIRNGSEVHNEAERALQSDFRTIVAAGGDGTVSAVASHLLGTDRCLGILPVGAFNYVARDWGIPLAAEDAIRVIAEGAERVVDVGEVNGRAFLNNAGLGGYAMIVRRRERVFNSWGRSRIVAYWVILRSLFDLRQSLRLKVTVDGEVWDTGLRWYLSPRALTSLSSIASRAATGTWPATANSSVCADLFVFASGKTHYACLPPPPSVQHHTSNHRQPIVRRERPVFRDCFTRPDRAERYLRRMQV